MKFGTRLLFSLAGLTLLGATGLLQALFAQDSSAQVTLTTVAGDGTTIYGGDEPGGGLGRT